MSSRQEEKERRRQERLERERQEAAGAQRARRLRLVGGGVLAVAAVVAIVVVALGSNNTSSTHAGPKPSTTASSTVPPLPAPKITDAFAAAKAAGCTLTTYPSEGREHVTTTVNYKTNPPTSGFHNQDPAADGDYSGQPTPAKENYVHTLEHGRVEVQYRPGTPQTEVSQLQELVAENQGYHMLLFENNTNMPHAFAATAWTHLLGCPAFNPAIFDALRTFRDRYLDKGPEAIP